MAKKRRRPRRTPDADYHATSRDAPEVTSIRLDLHGMRAQEAERAIERHLQNSHDSMLPVVTIVHGHGTGTLRAVTADVLADSPLVTRHYPDVDSGATVAELRYGDGHKVFSRKANNRIVPTPVRRK